MPHVNANAFNLVRPTLAFGDDFTGFMANSFPRVRASPVYPFQEQALPIALNWRLPTNITAVSKLEHLSLPHADEILLNCTRYYAYEQFLPEDLASPLKQHFYGPSLRYMTNKYGMLCKTRDFRLNICTECAREDIQSERALVTWKRSHLLEGAMACQWHERPLFTFCSSCRRDAKENYGFMQPEMWRPPTRCVCKKSLVPTVLMKDRYLEAAIGMGQMAEEVFARTVKDTVSAPNIRGAVRRSLSTHIDRAGRPALLQNLLNSSMSPEMLAHMGFTQTSVRRFVMGGKADYVASPMKNIAVTYAFFGGFDGFYNAVDGTQIADGETNSSSYLHVLDSIQAKPRIPHLDRRNYLKLVDGLSTQEFRAKSKQARSWFAEVKKNQPEITRTALSSKFSRTEEFVFLKWVDDEWLTEQLVNPVAIERERHSKAMRNSTYFKKHIKKNWDEALKRHPMKMVTLNQIRQPMALKAFNAVLSEHKHLKREVRKYIESEAQWRRRMISLVAPKMKLYVPTHPLAKQSAYKGLTRKEFLRKFDTATKWIKRNVNASVTPADFLGHRKRRKRTV